MEEEDRRTLWCGNLHPKITDELLFELFLQAGPLEKVSIPKDKDGNPRTYAFVTFKHEVSVLYAMRIMDGTTLFGRNVVMKNRKVTEQNNRAQQMQPSRGGHHRSYSMPNNIPQMAPMMSPMGGNLLNQSLMALQGLQPCYIQQQVNMVPQARPHNVYQRQQSHGYQQDNYQQRQDNQHQQQRDGRHNNRDRDEGRGRSDNRPYDRHHRNRDRRDDKPYQRHRR